MMERCIDKRGAQRALHKPTHTQAAGQRAPTVVGHMGELYRLPSYNPMSTVAQPQLLTEFSVALFGPSSSLGTQAAAGGLSAEINMTQQQHVLLFNDALAALRNSSATRATFSVGFPLCTHLDA
jgi:hypothetical protein